MVAGLLWRGMIVGLLAGILCFAFLKVAGEPQVDRAIAFEEQAEARKAEAHAKADAASGRLPHDHAHEEELVSRPVQAGLGLFTGTAVYGAALGGLFSLAYAFALGRAGPLSPRATAALLALSGFVAVYLVPNLKYPANPPAIGEADTIGIRTALYFGMVAISLIAMVAAGFLRRSLADALGNWNAGLAASAFYLLAVSLAGFLLPGVNEVPADFPATTLYEFRIASLGAQVILWAAIGLGFGLAAKPLLVQRRKPMVPQPMTSR